MLVLVRFNCIMLVLVRFNSIMLGSTSTVSLQIFKPRAIQETQRERGNTETPAGGGGGEGD